MYNNLKAELECLKPKSLRALRLNVRERIGVMAERLRKSVLR